MSSDRRSRGESENGGRSGRAGWLDGEEVAKISGLGVL